MERQRWWNEKKPTFCVKGPMLFLLFCCSPEYLRQQLQRQPLLERGRRAAVHFHLKIHMKQCVFASIRINKLSVRYFKLKLHRHILRLILHLVKRGMIGPLRYYYAAFRGK